MLSKLERPDACTINIYESGQWIPPHVDSFKFARPFCTVSLLSEQATVFGEHMAELVVDGERSGDFGGK